MSDTENINPQPEIDAIVDKVLAHRPDNPIRRMASPLAHRPVVLPVFRHDPSRSTRRGLAGRSRLVRAIQQNPETRPTSR